MSDDKKMEAWEKGKLLAVGAAIGALAGGTPKELREEKIEQLKELLDQKWE